MNLTEISFAELQQQIQNYLTKQYAKASLLYSSASPFGQILNVVQSLFNLSIVYQKNSIKQYDMSDPNALNARVVRNTAITCGHNPSRKISATGTLKITPKAGANISSSIPGSKIVLTNRNAIKNKTNGLQYAINIGADTMTSTINTNSILYIPIIQGTWKTINFTGTGQPSQTYQVNIRGNTQEIENFNYEVIVNGSVWTIKSNILDMLPNETACVVRTGFNGGIDIWFGNSGYGAIPPVAATIEVNYLVSDGASGSIFRRTANDWTFIDPVLDGNGDTVNVNTVFDISIYTDINFGADSESIEFTKSLLPIVSTNFVLALPQQYAYYIKRLGVFSHVNAYQINGTVYIVVVPNIALYQNQNSSYFDVDPSAFVIDAYETSKIENYLTTSGTIMLTSKYVISSPTLSYYVINIWITTYSDAVQVNINSQIYDAISSYFLNFNRYDRVPKSDIIALIQPISGIYSVDLDFVCKNDEDYFIAEQTNTANNNTSYSSLTSLKTVKPSATFNPNTSNGVDPVLGDILFTSSQLPIIRGGWFDRNGIYYSSNINDNGPKSVNITNKGSIPTNNR